MLLLYIVAIYLRRFDLVLDSGRLMGDRFGTGAVTASGRTTFNDTSLSPSKCTNSGYPFAGGCANRQPDQPFEDRREANARSARMRQRPSNRVTGAAHPPPLARDE